MGAGAGAGAGAGKGKGVRSREPREGLEVSEESLPVDGDVVSRGGEGEVSLPEPRLGLWAVWVIRSMGGGGWRIESSLMWEEKEEEGEWKKEPVGDSKALVEGGDS